MQSAAGGYAQVLQQPGFRRLWLSALFTFTGSAISLVALPLLVYDITGSASLMSAVFSAQFLTEALVSPISGVMADTFDRKRLLMFATLARGSAVIFLPFANEAWHVAVIAVFLAIGKAIFQPAEMASIPNTVAREDLVTAMSLIQVTATLLRVIGPAVAAVIIGLSGPRPAFAIQAVCYFAGALVLTGLVLPETATRQTFSGLKDFLGYAKREMIEGLQVAWSVPIVRGVCATEALWSFVMASLSVAMVVFAKETIADRGNSDVTYAALFGTFSAGAVIGALVARRIERRRGLSVLLIVGYLGPLFLIPFGFTTSLPIIFACAFTVGFTDAWAVIAIYSYLAQSVSDDVRGRVFAILHGIIASSALVTFAITGWLTDRIGAPTTLAMIGLVVGVGGPLALIATGAIGYVRSGAAATNAINVAVDSESG